MGRAYRGPYARPSSYPVPYATALVWGTGISPIHAIYGEGPPLRIMGRVGANGSSPVGNGQGNIERQSPASGNADNPPEDETWGYPVDYSVDSFGMGADSSPSATAPATYEYMDDRPPWNDPPQQQRVRSNAGNHPPWGRSGEVLRAMRGGAQRLRRNPNGPVSAEPSNRRPNESVSEGWINKATSSTAYAEPSDPSQYEVQTSMRQRFGTRDNSRAQARATDAVRAKIASRVEPMVEKVYSGEERHFDMFPFQAEQINRGFRFRTAGTGYQEWMEANEVGVMMPIQRTPPPDPAAGVPEVSSAEDYGYTGEDTMYYAG